MAAAGAADDERSAAVRANAAEIDWRGVGAATAANYVLGGIWFAEPVFGGQWARSIGFNRPRDFRPAAHQYLGPLVGSALGSLAIERLAASTGAHSVGGGAALVGTGFGVGLSATYAVAPTIPQPGRFFAVTAAFQLAGYVLAGAVIGAARSRR